MDPTVAHPAETAVRSTERESNDDVDSVALPPIKYIQTPHLTRKPDAPQKSGPEWNPSLHDSIDRTSLTEVISSRSGYRIDQHQISFLEGPTLRGGRADVVPANVLNNQNLTDVVLAVKKFRSADDDRILAEFANELRLQTELSHENIIKLVGFVEERSKRIAWLVFPWMANGNLQEFLASGKWEIPERISLLYDVACGVEYLHSRNPPICHGDLRSHNILVNAENRGLIIDFGSARSVGTAPPPSTNHAMLPSPEDGRVALGDSFTADIKATLKSSGFPSPPTTTTAITLPDPYWTLRWAAPELVLGASPALNSDIWSFGWLCWVIITDRLPFDDIDEGSAAEIITSIMQRNVPSLSQVPGFSFIPRLRSLMDDCWRLEPEDRPSATSCKDIIFWMPRAIPTQRDATKPSPTLLRVTGEMYVGASRISDGLKHIARALEIARANGDSAETALSLLSLGRVHSIQCDYAEAEEAFNEAKDVFIETQDDAGTAEATYGLARLQERRGEISKANALYVQAQGMYEGASNRLGLADSTYGLANIQRLQYNLDVAKPAYLEAEKLYHEIGKPLGLVGLARTKCGLGDIHRQQGIHNKAEELYQEARNIFKKVDHPLGLADALYGSGHIHLIQGRYTEAASCFQEAEAIHTRIGNRLGLAEITCGKGDLYRAQGRYDDAETIYSKARELYTVVDHRLGAADATCGLAQISRIQGGDKEAEMLFYEASRIYEERGYGMGGASAALGLAAVFIERLEYEEASSNITKALEFYTQAAILPLKASALMMLALTYELQEQSNKSEVSINEAITIYSTVGDESGVLACQELLQGVRDSSETATS